jgi:acyl-CoA synthetase (AMP-forming)/AMP-acid ligase II
MATGQQALARLWKQAAAACRARPALSVPGGPPITFAELDDRAEEAARRLRDCGAVPGTGVIVSLPRGPAVPIAILGVWLAAGVAIPARDGDGIARLARPTGARLLIDDSGDRAAARDGFAVRTLPDAPPAQTPLGAHHAYVMATTGTAGAPKIVAVTHRTSAAVMNGLRRIVSISPGEHAAHTASFVFSSSIRQLMLPLTSGARVTVCGSGGQFDPGQLLDLAGTGVTSLDLTPSQIQAVLGYLELRPDAPVPRSLRRLLVASEVFTPAMHTRWRAAVSTRHDVFHLYGQTETGGSISAMLVPEQPPPSGTAAAPHALPIAQPFPPFSGVLASRPGGLKELSVAGLDPSDMVLAPLPGAEEAQDAGPGPVTWIHGMPGPRPTGDLFELNGDGTLSYAGRGDSQVKILGVRVDAGLIERRAMALPGVGHVIAAAAERPAGGQALYVIFTARPGAAAPAVDAVAACAAGIVGGPVPAPRVVQLDEMPLNPSGKADRAAALHRAIAQVDNPGADPADIAAIWARHAAIPAPGAGQAPLDFFASGGDSLAMIGMLAEVSRTFGVRVMPGQFHADPTLAGLRQMIAEGRRSAPAAAPNRAGGPDMRATAAQRSIWISEKLHADPARYWLTVTLEAAADLDESRLLAAVRSTMTRFDILRCGFAEHDGELVIVPDAHPAAEALLDAPGALSLRAMDSGTRLIRAAVSRPGGRRRMDVSVHHAVADRRSLQTILQSIAAGYGRPGEQPDPGQGFLQAMPALRPAGRDLGEAAAFWSSCLPQPPGEPQATGDVQIQRTGARCPVTAPEGGATRHAVLLWAFHQAIAAAGLPQPQLIGIDVDLRPPGAAGAVGPYVHALPVCLPAHAPARAGPQAAMAAISGMLAHARVPLNSLGPLAPRPTGDPRQPFYRYKLVYQADPYPPLEFDGREARYIATPAGIAENTITLFAREEGGMLALDLAWDGRALGEHEARALLDAVTAYGHSVGQDRP